MKKEKPKQSEPTRPKKTKEVKTKKGEKKFRNKPLQMKLCTHSFTPFSNRSFRLMTEAMGVCRHENPPSGHLYPLITPTVATNPNYDWLGSCCRHRHCRASPRVYTFPRCNLHIYQVQTSSSFSAMDQSGVGDDKFSTSRWCLRALRHWKTA